ncbi:Non-homologous end joining protein Ku [Streptomyces alboniger]
MADRELRTAQQLIDALSIDWDPSDYHDTYEERVRNSSRPNGRARKWREEGPPDATNVVDLMSALERSVERNRAGRGGKGGRGSRDGRGGRGGRGTPAKSRKRPEPDLSSLTKSELYRRATDAGVPGRSKMSREQLVEALEGRRHAA